MNRENQIDHVVYLDSKAKELDKVIDGSKSMIIRGAIGRKLPYGRVNENDVLYFINNNSEGVIKAKAILDTVFNSDKMSREESIALVKKYQDKLNLSESKFTKWAGKRYIVLVGLNQVEGLNPFEIDRSNYGNMDDWLIVEKISSVMK